MKNEELKKLENFVVNNQKLDQLEEHLAQFNMFEAVGAVRQELRHSDFLSFIFDPSRNHGLGDSLLKMVLKNIVKQVEKAEINAVHLDIMDLEKAEVRREWRDLDLLILDRENNLVIVIENKIDSKESDGQLAKYSCVLDKEFSNYQKLKIFLTPEGISPSEDNEDWITYSYLNLSKVLDRYISAKKTLMGEQVTLIISHYLELLKRHIVPNTDIEKLCRDIYFEHKAAIDLIYNHIPDTQLEISEALQDLINENSELVLDNSGKSRIRFSFKSWDEYEPQRKLGEWTESRRVLIFQIENVENSLLVKLIIGPGPDDLRTHLFKASFLSDKLLKGKNKSKSDTYTQVYREDILFDQDYKDNNFDELMAIMKKRFKAFLKCDKQEIEQVFTKAFQDLEKNSN